MLNVHAVAETLKQFPAIILPFGREARGRLMGVLAVLRLTAVEEQRISGRLPPLVSEAPPVAAAQGPRTHVKVDLHKLGATIQTLEFFRADADVEAPLSSTMASWYDRISSSFAEEA